FADASFTGTNNYLTGKAGLYLPEIDFVDDGFNIEGAYGIDLSSVIGIKNLVLELGLGYYKASNEQTYSFGSGLSSSTTKEEVDISTIPMTVDGIYTFEFNGPFSLYAGAGLGLYYVMWEWELETSSILLGSTSSSYADDELKFGFNLLGGGRYHLNNQMDLIAEVKYASVSDDVGGVFFNVGLKYNF
ncbi:MAG: outer membrane beta-barrel protein, partial [Deltaproteobacteria bacterium]